MQIPPGLVSGENGRTGWQAISVIYTVICLKYILDRVVAKRWITAVY